VKSHKTQVAAEAAVGQVSVKVLRELQTYKKNKKFFTNTLVSVRQQCWPQNTNRECRKPFWMLWVREQLQ